MTPLCISPSSLNLATLPPGTQARVLGVGGDRPFQRRLLSLGLAQGSQVQVVRCAPLGDPLHIKVGHHSLAIRRSEAVHVAVEVHA